MHETQWETTITVLLRICYNMRILSEEKIVYSKEILNVSRHIRLSRNLLMETVQLRPSHKINVQIIRSLVVSVIALFFDFGLLVILKQIFGINYLIAAAMSFSVGVLINYVLSVTWVFANRKLSSRNTEFLVFVMINVIGLGLNLLIIAGFVQFGHLDYRLSKVVSTVVVFFWNFTMRKKILY